jgi:regulator of protease activity HflC (stomatin/prohibitin superfamily)
MRQVGAAQMMHQFAMLRAEPAGYPLRRGRRVTINQWEQGLLFRHGRLETVLGPGAHRHWGGGFTLRAVDMRPWIVLLPTQEIPTSDGVTVKVTVAGQARVADATTYVTAARDNEQALYLAIQVALRGMIATTTVEDLLTGRGDAGGRLLAGVRGLDALGIAVEQLSSRTSFFPPNSSELKPRCSSPAHRGQRLLNERAAKQRHCAAWQTQPVWLRTTRRCSSYASCSSWSQRRDTPS